jgi:hypothetical protein
MMIEHSIDAMQSKDARRSVVVVVVGYLLASGPGRAARRTSGSEKT